MNESKYGSWGLGVSWRVSLEVRGPGRESVPQGTFVIQEPEGKEQVTAEARTGSRQRHCSIASPESGAGARAVRAVEGGRLGRVGGQAGASRQAGCQLGRQAGRQAGRLPGR